MNRSGLTILLILTAIFYSCDKGSESGRLEQTITTSVEGNLSFTGILGTLDPRGIKVECGGQSVILDSTGQFLFNNVSLNSELATITASKNGTLIQVKSFVPNKTHNFIRTETWETVGPGGDNFSNLATHNSGSLYGVVFNIVIEAGSFAGNSALFQYNYFHPFLETFLSFPYGQLPGNAVAEGDNGEIIGLQMVSDCFYMGVVDAAGNKLPLLSGKKLAATKYREFDLDLGSGPYSLYFFDIAKGLWIKTSDATYDVAGQRFKGTSGSVNGWFVFAHPFDVVRFSGRLVTANTYPLFSLLRINKVGEENYGYVTYSNNNGEVEGYLPKNVPVEMMLIQPEAGANYQFGQTELIYKKSLGTFNSTADLGEQACGNMGDTTRRAILTYKGRVVDCNDQPLSNMIVMDGARVADVFPVIRTDANGKFVLNYSRGDAFVVNNSLVVHNPASGQRSQILLPMLDTRNVNTTNRDLGKIVLCNTNTAEFMTITVDGVVTDFRPPATPLLYSTPSAGIVDPTATKVEAVTPATGTSFELSYYGNYNIGQKGIRTFAVNSLPFSQWISTPVLTITENKNTGSFYTAGSFQNLQMKYTNGTIHTLSCSFRVKNN